MKQLQSWADLHGGWIVFESSGGFLLPDGSVRTPEASVVRLDRWQALSGEQREDFPPLFPDLVVELASRSDDPEALRCKMAAYIAKGAWLGWLLLTSSRSVEVGTPGQGVLAPTPARMLGNVPRLGAGAEFGGLALDLAEIWQA